MTRSAIHRSNVLNITIYDRLKKQIRNLAPGTPLESERQLAAGLGVSRPTLRHALDRLRDEDLLETRRGSGTYTTEAVLQKTVVTLFYNNDLGSSEDSYGSCYQALHEKVTSGGHRMEVLLNNDPHLRPGPPLQELETIGTVDALILLGIMDAGYVRQALDLGLPVITVDYALPGTQTDAVIFDSFGAGCQMMEFLVVNGHTRVAFIGGYRGNPNNRHPEADSLRVKAGLDYTAQLHGTHLMENWITELPMGDNSGAEDHITNCLDSKERPTGLAFFDPAHAQGAIRALKRKGLSVPEDISIICRGQAEYLPAETKPITTIPVNIREMGRIAAQALQLRLEDENAGPMHITIPSALLDRGTAGPAGPQ